MNFFVLALEMLGTVSFAVSGAMVGLKQRMDIFGVSIMGLVTACGGGAMRDLFLGQLPPAVFSQPAYPLAAIIVSLVVFLPLVRKRFALPERVYENIHNLVDAIGLGVFTAAGVGATMWAGFGDNFFFAVFLGAITGVGGGVLRDVLAGLPPYIFIKHIYACASIVGAIVCYALWGALGETGAMLLCCAVVVIIRVLAAKYRWSLPKASGVSPEK